MNHFEIKDIFIIIGSLAISYVYYSFWYKFLEVIAERRYALELKNKRK